jgi:hypothetical protein
LETGSDSWPTQSNELIPRIPGVRRRTCGVRQRLEVAVVVIRRTLRPQRQLLVGGVIVRRGDCGRHPRAPKAAPGPDAPSRFIIAVRQRPQRRRSLGVRQRGEPRGRVIAVRHHDAISQGQTAAPPRRIIRERHVPSVLADFDQPVGGVVGVRDRRLALHGQTRAPAGRIIRATGSDLLIDYGRRRPRQVAQVNMQA